MPYITDKNGRRVLVELDDLSWEEILKLPRNAFEPDEFDSLTDDEKETVRERDPDSQARMEKLIKLFVGPYTWVRDDANEDYILETVGTDGFENFLLEQADHLIERARDTGASADAVIDEIIDDFENDGYSEDDATEAVEKALGDEVVYDRSLSDEYSVAFYKDGRTEEQIEVESGELRDALEGMYPDEVEAAAKEIDHQTDGTFRSWGPGRRRTLTASDIKDASKRYGFSATVNVYYYVDWDPDWDRVRARATEILEEEYEPEEPESDAAREAREAREARSLEERKVMKFPDGFFWLELRPDELRAEGARTEGGLHHCIGKTDAEGGYGYPEALKAGKGRAFSLRTPSDRRKITLWADVQPNTFDEAGNPLVRGITQVKGKLNRLVGWDLGGAGEKNFKEDEVKKTIVFIKDYLGYPPLMVNDLRPALMYLGKHDTDWFEKNIGPWQGDRNVPRGNPAPRGHACPDCGGEATGFCAPMRHDNPSSTIVKRRAGESQRAFDQRVLSYMGEDDYADVADDGSQAEIFWGAAKKKPKLPPARTVRRRGR
jgi:hypothetical protein